MSWAAWKLIRERLWLCNFIHCLEVEDLLLVIETIQTCNNVTDHESMALDYEYKSTIYNGQHVVVPIPPGAVYSAIPLSKDEVRLLRIEPSDDDQRVLECQLTSHDLENAPYYTALSYEWGNPSQWAEISVNGLSYPVTVNLWYALQQLRQKRFLSVWVDAICIRQDNDQEKEIHVSRMKEIYQSADLVVVWLGPERESSAQVMQILDRIDLSRRRRQSGSIRPWTPTASQIEKIDVPLEAFFRRSYWRRAWIRQEIGVASALKILCGSEMADWKGLEVLLREVLDAYQLPTRYQKNVTSLLNERSDRLEGRTKGLLEVICDSRAAIASDYRDRVYAFLGLSFDGSDFVAQPRYRWSKRAICMHMTRTAILAKKNLDIILLRSQGSPQAETAVLPSWCPDYTYVGQEQIQRNMAKYVSGRDIRYRLGVQNYRWKTTQDSYPKREIFQHLVTGHLRVRGIVLGRVNGLGRALGHKDEVKQAPDSLWETQLSDRVIFSRISHALTLYARDQSSKAELHTALNHLFLSEATYKMYFGSAIHGRKVYNSLSKWRRLNRLFKIRGQTIWSRGDGWRANARTFFSSAASKDVLQDAVIKSISSRAGVESSNVETKYDNRPSVLQNMLTAMNDLVEEGLRIMTTNSDRVGWAHPLTQLDDCIVLLSGCSLPAVLRPSGINNTFSVVGHAYVEGAMNNEVWSLVDPQEMQEIWLV